MPAGNIASGKEKLRGYCVPLGGALLVRQRLMVTAIGFLFSVLAQLIASTSLQASLIDTTVFVLHVLLWTQIGAQVGFFGRWDAEKSFHQTLQGPAAFTVPGSAAISAIFILIGSGAKIGLLETSLVCAGWNLLLLRMLWRFGVGGRLPLSESYGPTVEAVQESLV